jgi:hypothetical protein
MTVATFQPQGVGLMREYDIGHGTHGGDFYIKGKGGNFRLIGLKAPLGLDHSILKGLHPVHISLGISWKILENHLGVTVLFGKWGPWLRDRGKVLPCVYPGSRQRSG